MAIRHIAIYQGDCLQTLPRVPAVHAVVTSPPYYGLRDYLVEPSDWPAITYQPMPGLPPVVIPAMRCCLGLETTPEAYVAHLVHVFRLVRERLRDDGAVWLNVGDSYAANRSYQVSPTKWGNLPQGQSASVPEGLKPKDLIGIPWRLAFALQADGWYLRSDCVWNRVNCMPESVTDRPTRAHEMVFLLAKSERYYMDMDAVREPMGEWLERDKRYGPGKSRDRSAEPYISTSALAGPHNGLSKVSEDGMRNLRTVWDLSTTPFSAKELGIDDADHYAVMSRHLADRCLKMALSSAGCCAECGAQWIRKVERTEEPDTSGKGSRFDKGKTGVNGACRVQSGERTLKRLVGWKPSCSHDGFDPVPCTVLDPFGGAGTTALCASRLGHNAVLCEVNPESVRIAKARLEADAPMFNRVEVVTAESSPNGQSALDGSGELAVK